MVYGKVYDNDMENNKFDILLQYQTDKRYLTPREIKYGSLDLNFNLSPHEYGEYLLYLETKLSESDTFLSFPLTTFNNASIHLCECLDFKALYHDVVNLVREDLALNGSLLSERDPFGFDRSRIYSEIEGTLNVENVPTTRRKLRELLEEGKEPTNRNDAIIRNMGRAIDFIKAKPDFNEANLFRLYTLLSDGCLDEEDKLRPGDIYRYDEVEVESYLGCPEDKIKACMDSLFKYVNDALGKKDDPFGFLLPHICHYYIIYIHPYFDYNGRTARMVSFWVSLLMNNEAVPPLISEAINETKGKYYQAIRDSRDSHNDITYFVIYLLRTTISFYLSYKRLEDIFQKAKDKGISLTETELSYVKHILLNARGAFNYADFLKFTHISISKQGALKILNKFIEAGILKEVESKSKTKLFIVAE